MPNMNTTSLTIVNDIHVTVPASPQFMTTYVLHEQNDWFEDEIKFIRHFIRPGMKVIDIGANYGLYTLTMAGIIGDSGKIWAFEPTKSTADCLRESILTNKFNNIKLIQSGLSDRLGKAKLFTSPNSELNSLSRGVVPGNQHETISLMTLDHCNNKYGWRDIDFIKLDAEGEENNILKKGKKALASLSPLIMFELKHGNSINFPLIDRFKSMGYESYRLVPGLNILIPFDHNDPLDNYLLNLFCCKEDKASKLEKEEIIVRSWEPKDAPENSQAKKYCEGLAHGAFISSMENVNQDSDQDAYMSILNKYIMSIDNTESRSSRVSCLMESLDGLKDMIAKGEHRIERLVTFSRIAFDAGERSLGVEILSNLINKYGSNINFELNEVFLPASKRYDSVIPDKGINAWLFSSILEKCIEMHAFSSYFTKGATLPLFERLNSLGYMDINMERRYKLVKLSFS